MFELICDPNIAYLFHLSYLNKLKLIFETYKMNKSFESISQANNTMTAGAFTATLKGKINGLEETIKAL